jgi:hypothetical protein
LNSNVRYAPQFWPFDLIARDPRSGIQINDRMVQTGIWVINLSASEACRTHEVAEASAISKQTMRKTAKRIALILLGVAVVGTVSIFPLLYHQGKRAPVAVPEHVALGSSYAAGFGLGTLTPDSPFVCQRSING